MLNVRVFWFKLPVEIARMRKEMEEELATNVSN